MAVAIVLGVFLLSPPSGKEAERESTKSYYIVTAFNGDKFKVKSINQRPSWCECEKADGGWVHIHGNFVIEEVTAAEQEM
jgi:hypothetical protein